MAAYESFDGVCLRSNHVAHDYKRVFLLHIEKETDFKKFRGGFFGF